ncbi:MAG TPA: hypothetical protein ENJ27_00860 [Candidatus Moranbacteria bacterium]|nr:hypothetical protein [Candidatus Moranbacteria bacterium]
MRILLFISVIIVSCTGLRHNTKINNIKDFYLDKNNFALIKLSPKNNANIINAYNKWIKHNAGKSYDFYSERILKNTNALQIQDSIRVFNSGIDTQIVKKPKLIRRMRIGPEVFSKIPGKYLKLLIKITIDKSGMVEYSELYDILRSEDEKTDNDYSSGINPWRFKRIYSEDINFIEKSLYNSLGLYFEPAIYKGRKVKVNMIVPYIYKNR